MNALATDQAAVRAGRSTTVRSSGARLTLAYIGGYAEKDEDKMTADSVITSRQALRQTAVDPAHEL